MRTRVSGAKMLAYAVVGTVACTVTAFAGEVTLRAKNGDFEIKGELTAYDRNQYTISTTSVGSMSLDASRFVCVSGSCPTGAVAIKTEPTPADVSTGPT